MKVKLMFFLTVAVMMAMATSALAADESSKANLAQQANNPIANMISLPFQYNANFGISPHDRTQHVLSIQPVIPFELSEDWLLVTRWVLPIIYQPDVLENFGGNPRHWQPQPGLFLFTLVEADRTAGRTGLRLRAGSPGADEDRPRSGVEHMGTRSDGAGCLSNG